jgi:hypothetical protein
MEQTVDLGFGVSFVKILRRVLVNLMMAWNWAFGMGRALNKLLGMVLLASSWHKSMVGYRRPGCIF